MAQLHAQVEMLTNFIVPIYQNVLDNNNNVLEAKKDTVDILVDSISRYAVTDNKVEYYTLVPMLQFIEQAIAVKIKELSKVQKNSDVSNMITFYKDLLVKIHTFHDICLKSKKE